MYDSYHFFALSGFTIFMYLTTVFLKNKDKISLVLHRKIWNTVLLVSFVISGFLGMVLAFAIDSSLPLSLYRFFLWFHVELGIIMAIVSFSHLFWHIRYYFPKSK